MEQNTDFVSLSELSQLLSVPLEGLAAAASSGQQLDRASELQRKRLGQVRERPWQSALELAGMPAPAGGLVWRRSDVEALLADGARRKRVRSAAIQGLVGLPFRL